MKEITPNKDFWVKDEFSTKCSNCRVFFSFSFRKHHCRNCGQIFCKACCSKTIQLGFLGYQDSFEHVCDVCYDFILKEQKKSKKKISDSEAFEKKILQNLKRIYTRNIKPFEIQYKYEDFSSRILKPRDFLSKPIVLLVGYDNSSKIEFIRNLCKRDIPLRFNESEILNNQFLVVDGNSDSTSDSFISGHELSHSQYKPFSFLMDFGPLFLNNLECSELSTISHDGAASILKNITFINTPSLSNYKTGNKCIFNMLKVFKSFANNCNKIFFLVDAKKININEKFKEIMTSFKDNVEKISIILYNTEDMVYDQLLNVTMNLMWSYSQILQAPKCSELYLWSFKTTELKEAGFNELYKLNKRKLMDSFLSLPASLVINKIDHMIKRASSARLHAFIIDHLRCKLPFFHAERHFNDLINTLKEEYLEIQKKYDIPVDDFPHPKQYNIILKKKNSDYLKSFPPFNIRMISELNDAIKKLLPNLRKSFLSALSEIETQSQITRMSSDGSEPEWIIKAENFLLYKQHFESLKNEDDKLSINVLENLLIVKNITNEQIEDIMSLTDLKNEEFVNVRDFAIVMYLVDTVEKNPNIEIQSLSIPEILMPKSSS